MEIDFEPEEDQLVNEPIIDPKPKKKAKVTPVVKLDFEPIEEPVKKKESTSLYGKDSSKPAPLDFEPIEPSSESVQPSLTNKQVSDLSKIKVGEQKSPEQIRADYEKKQAEENSARNFATGEKTTDDTLTSLEKGVTGIIKHIIPSAWASAKSGGVRIDPYTEADLKNKDAVSDAANFLFRKKLSEGDVLGALNVGDKEAVDYIKEQITRPEAYQKEQIDEKLRLFNQSKEEQQKFNNYTQNTVKSLSDINSPGDVAAYVAYNVGQSIPQMGMALATGGMSGYLQEYGDIYSQQIQKLAQDNGISEEEVINQKLDDPSAGKYSALLAAAMDRLGVEAIFKNFGKDALKNMIRSSSKIEAAKQIGKSALTSGVSEGLTEGAQYVTEEIGSSLAAGRSVQQSVKDVSGNQLLESIAAGATSGGLLGGAGSVSPSSDNFHINAPEGDLFTAPTSVDVIKTESVSIDPTNVDQVSASAVRIQEQIEKDSTVPLKYEVKPVEGSAKGTNFDYTPNKDLTPEQKSIEDKFAKDLDQNYQAKKEEYIKKFGNVIDADNARMLSEDYVTDPEKNSISVHRPASSFLLQVYKDMLAQPAPEGKKNLVVFLGGGAGAGKSSLNVGSTSEAQIVQNTNMAPYQVSKNQINRALNAGKDVEVNYIYRDPVKSFEEGVIPRAIKTGRTISISEFIRTHLDSLATIKKLQNDYAGDSKIKINVFDNTKGKGEEKLSSFDELKVKDYSADELSAELNGVADRLFKEGKISDTLYNQFIGNKKQQDNASPIRKDQGTVPQEGNIGKEVQTNSSSDVQQNPPGSQGNAEAQQQEGSQVDTEEQKLSGIKKALASEETVYATEIEKRSTQQMLMKAKEQVDSGEVNPKSIVDEIAQGNARALQPHEVSALVYYKTQLDNRSDQVNEALIKAIDSGDKDAELGLRTQMKSIQDDIASYETMSVKTAYEQSLAFRLRQMLLNNEYNLQSQILKYKANNNGQISKEQEQKFVELDKQLKEANSKIAQYEEQGKAKQAEQSLIEIRQNLEKERIRRRKLITEEKKVKINNFFDSLKVKDVGGTANDITRVVGASIWNGSMEVVKQATLAGANLANAVQAGIDHIKEHYKGADFDPEEFRKIVAPNLEKIIPSAKENILSEPKIKNGRLTIPKQLIKDVVEGGAETIEEVTDQIHSIVKETLPDVTTREVRDAITGYGKTVSMSKEEIDKKIRDIKTLGRMVSSLEDIENKKRPLRSGLQRDKPTDEQRKLKREINEKIKELPVDDGEIEQAWKNALDSIKARLKNNIADLESQIDKGEKTPKKKGVLYDAEASALKQQRDELKKQLEEMEGPSKMSDEQRVRLAINNVNKSISEYERRIKEKDFSQKEKTQAPVSEQLTALKKRRDDLKKTYSDLEKEAGIAEKKRLENYKKAVKKSLENYERRIKEKDFITPKREEVKADEEAKRLRFERDKIKEQFQVEQEKNRLANRPLSEKIWDTTVDVLNLPKSLLASIDMSAPFRQGLILSAGNPIIAGKSTAEMFRQAFSQERADKWLHAVKESPEYALMKSSKLYLAEPNTKLTAKEEQFLSNFAGKIPILGRLVKGSERAYTGYLNKLRVDVFANGVDRLSESGITPETNPEAYKAWASFINNATGRGDLGSLEEASTVLNAFFFSPRFVASRVNVLNPVSYAKMPKAARVLAMKNMAAYLGFYALVMSMAAAAGADTEFDPRSSDFGKIKIGNTRYDIGAGMNQIIRFFAQLISAQRKSTKTGKIMELDGKGPFGQDRTDVIKQFARSKLSPVASTGVNLLVGKDMVGNDVTWQTEAVKNVTPLYIQDIYSMYEKEGPTGVITTAIPAFFGVGVQNYENKKKKH